MLFSQQNWEAAIVVSGIWLVYLAAFRVTRCRVETQKHRPCLWLVRGLFGTCEFHVGYKRSLPRLIRGDGFVGLPTFMWPRDDFAGAWRYEPQPAVAAASVGSRKTQSRDDRSMTVLTAAGIVAGVIAWFGTSGWVDRSVRSWVRSVTVRGRQSVRLDPVDSRA